MTSRTFIVVPDGKSFRIHVRTVYEKSSKRRLEEVRGYPTENSAQNDLKRLKSHLLDNGRAVKTFQKNFSNEWNCKNTAEVQSYRAAIAPLKGVIMMRRNHNLNREYSLYVKLMVASQTAYDSREIWEKNFADDAGMKERLLRRHARDPKVLHASIIKGMLSIEASTSLDSIRCSIIYFNERSVTLNSQLSEANCKLLTSRKAMYSGETFSLLLRAKFEDEESNKEFIDLTVDDAFTMTNTSKSQLVRSILQCSVTEKIYTSLRGKMKEELQLLQDILVQVGDVRSDLRESEEKIECHWQRIKHCKRTNSIIHIVERVATDTGNVIGSATITRWFNDFKKLGSFKEDMRGCYQRRFFLEEHGLLRQFKLYLKNERSLTVDAAKRSLEHLIEINAAKDESTEQDKLSLLPLNRRTVHRWMLQCGCKYEKATVSYYTDSHEAEETKKDFRER